MEIYETLGRENAKILATLGKLEDTAAHQPEVRAELLRQLKSHLLVEKKIAEDRLYPLLLASPKTYTAVERARRENGEIENLLAQLAAAELGDPDTRYLLENLGSLVRLHVEWEENELFRQARAVIPPEQAALLGETAAGEQEDLYHRFLQE